MRSLKGACAWNRAGVYAFCTRLERTAAATDTWQPLTFAVLGRALFWDTEGTSHGGNVIRASRGSRGRCGRGWRARSHCASWAKGSTPRPGARRTKARAGTGASVHAREWYKMQEILRRCPAYGTLKKEDPPTAKTRRWGGSCSSTS
jgi:hypothetical protein